MRSCATVVLCLAALTTASPDVMPDSEPESDSEEDSEREDVLRLKREIMRMSTSEIQARFGTRHARFPTPKRQKKIDHFVVLFMENHAADNYFGCMDLRGFDGIRNHSVPKDPSDPSKGNVDITCGKAHYVCPGGPGYDTFAGKFGPGGNPHSYPYSEQSDKFSALHGASEGGTAVSGFSPEQVPIKASIAKHFGVFNRFFSAVPSASSPNHLFTQSATSCGMQANALYNDCGGKNVSFPQKTIYDSLAEHNLSFGLFMNSTCGLDGLPCHGESPTDPDSASAISTPDVAMEGVARYTDGVHYYRRGSARWADDGGRFFVRYKKYFYSQELFYRRAAAGDLPAFSWLHPPIQACDHPCHDVAKGERLLKDVYEALRAGKAWERTLLLVVYDDAGGYYDHVVPPHEGVPADESPCVLPGVHPKCGEVFDFREGGGHSSASFCTESRELRRLFGGLYSCGHSASFTS